MSPEQVRFVVARTEHTSNRAACKAIGIAYQTRSHWPKDVIGKIKRAIILAEIEPLTTAIHMRSVALSKAMAVKIKGLDSKVEKVRQAAATEIIEWELGKATQPTDINIDAPLRVTVDF